MDYFSSRFTESTTSRKGDRRHRERPGRPVERKQCPGPVATTTNAGIQSKKTEMVEKATDTDTYGTLGSLLRISFLWFLWLQEGRERMDAEFWSARVKRQQAAEPAQFYTERYASLEDFEEEDEERGDFACPFCYKDFDIGSLCHHIEDEHFFEANHAVCPVCAAKVGKDMFGHITLQHAHLFKLQRRRRFRKGGMPSNSALSCLGKELREGQLQYLLGGASSCAGATSSSAAPDPLISSFVYNLPIYEAEKHLEPTLSTEESLTKNSTSDLQIRTRECACM